MLRRSCLHLHSKLLSPKNHKMVRFDVQFVFNELVTRFTQRWVGNYLNSVMAEIGGTLTGLG